MSRTFARLLAALMALSLVAAACSGDDDDGATTDGTGGSEATTTTAGGTEETTGDTSGGDDGDGAIDYEAIGLWDDGPCDESAPPLVLGLMTVFQSPIVSLEDQAIALEASATAFNARGGANGSCIEVHTCDDGASIDQAVACVREIDEAGVVATVNDQGTAGQAEVSAAMVEAGIPRVAGNVTSSDWGDQNAYPLDASGTGGTFMQPGALVDAGLTNIGIIRVDLAAASALIGLLNDLFADDGASFEYDAPVPAGTTDFSQFILGAQDAGVEGVTLSIGEQEAVQVVRAAQQLGTPLRIAAGLGTFSHAAVAELGDFAEQMVFTDGFPPATIELPVYEALRADLAASGEDALQPENLKASPMRSWIGLYALLRMIRDSQLTDFTRENITAMLQDATDVPMLDMFGGEDWTPNTNHEGLFQRSGIDHWSVYGWDPDAPAPDGLEGNFVETGVMNFSEVLCGSPFGAPPPCG